VGAGSLTLRRRGNRGPAQQSWLQNTDVKKRGGGKKGKGEGGEKHSQNRNLQWRRRGAERGVDSRYGREGGKQGLLWVKGKEGKKISGQEKKKSLIGSKKDNPLGTTWDKKSKGFTKLGESERVENWKVHVKGKDRVAKTQDRK